MMIKMGEVNCSTIAFAEVVSLFATVKLEVGAAGEKSPR